MIGWMKSENEEKPIRCTEERSSHSMKAFLLCKDNLKKNIMSFFFFSFSGLFHMVLLFNQGQFSSKSIGSGW